MTKYTLVVSAVNFSEGGPLTVLRDCLRAASRTLGDCWHIIALVHEKQLFEPTAGVTYLEFPWAKRSWLFRLYYEWAYFKILSKKIKPDLWLSLHDITPRVITRKQAVYCHNPAPFFEVALRDALLDPKLYLFNRYYKYLYSCRILENDHVIVQQSWLREEFKRCFKLDTVVVAYPEPEQQQFERIFEPTTKKANIVFFYPALPRVPKNMEVIFEAVQILNAQNVSGFEVRLTINGEENRYARALVRKYPQVKGIVFSGRLGPTQMREHYAYSDCVLFPSRLETWGLPISEAKAYGLPLIVADLPYAHETVASYDKVRFFPPRDPEALAALMKQFISGELAFQSVCGAVPAQPFVDNWPDLIRLLVKDLDQAVPQ